jgi:cbb3-type cytochrome oxidase subunit 1
LKINISQSHFPGVTYAIRGWWYGHSMKGDEQAARGALLFLNMWDQQEENVLALPLSLDFF